MKKKLITLAGAMMLVVAMATSAMAANVSSVQESAKPDVNYDGIVANNGTKITKDDVVIADSKVNVDLKDEAVSKLVAKVENAKVATIFDVSLKNAEAVFANGGSVDIPFTVDGIEGKTVVVLHFNEKTNAWEVVKSSVKGNVVTATFTSLSPVAIVVGDAQGSVVEDDDMGMGFETMAVMGVALCAVVFFFSVKKARA